jgi:fructose 1,6-bisphosphatase
VLRQLPSILLILHHPGSCHSAISSYRLRLLAALSTADSRIIRLVKIQSGVHQKGAVSEECRAFVVKGWINWAV